MEAQGTPHGDQNGGISWTFRNSLPEALPERILNGFGEDFGRVLEGFGSLGGPHGYENRYISKKIQALPPGSPKEGFG